METPDDVRSAGSSPGGTSAGGGATTSGDPDVQQLKAEISETQAELQQTVAEIQERLSPSHLKEQATDAVRDATVGRVQHMMTHAGETLGQVAENTRDVAGRMTSGVRSNPIPYALIAIGAVWLIANNRASRRWSSDYEGDSAWGDTTDYEASPGATGYGGSEFGAYASTGISSAGSAGDEGSASRLDTAAARERARRAMMQARTRLDSMLHENPMALGIVALAAGALVGAALPSTQTESRYLGPARETLVETAREAAQNAVQKVAGTDEHAEGGNSGSHGSPGGAHV
jgi:ElaB/YqjD/DUF883 family membrane-anchored ribosome-binding protein